MKLPPLIISGSYKYVPNIMNYSRLIHFHTRFRSNRQLILTHSGLLKPTDPLALFKGPHYNFVFKCSIFLEYI